MDDTMNSFKEFHGMPEVEKISESSRDPNGSCRLYTSREINGEDCIQFWRDTLRHFCPPSGEFMEFWPQKPQRYRYNPQLNFFLFMFHFSKIKKYNILLSQLKAKFKIYLIKNII